MRGVRNAERSELAVVGAGEVLGRDGAKDAAGRADRERRTTRARRRSGRNADASARTRPRPRRPRAA